MQRPPSSLLTPAVADTQRYRAGTLSTVEMKDACIEKLQNVVSEFQERRSKVTPETVQYFQDVNRAIDPTPSRAAAGAAATA